MVAGISLLGISVSLRSQLQRKQVSSLRGLADRFGGYRRGLCSCLTLAKPVWRHAASSCAFRTCSHLQCLQWGMPGRSSLPGFTCFENSYRCAKSCSSVNATPGESKSWFAIESRRSWNSNSAFSALHGGPREPQEPSDGGVGFLV